MITSAVDLYFLEKQLGDKTASSLKIGLKNAISKTTNTKTGEALRLADSRVRFSDRRIQRFIIKAPGYIFKQHYGFEGQKKNGINMRLKPTDVLNKMLENANALEKFIDELSEIRLSQVTSKIIFEKNGN